jgi:anti-repressor protein
MELTPFTFPETAQPVRTVLIDGEPWFIAADVTAILGYTNGRMAVGALPERMKGVTKADTPGGQQQMTVINESGVYRLVMRSTLPAAEMFQDWIAEEVLPSIRRTGAYAVPALSNRDLALMVIAEADRADLAERRVAELAPAAASWEALASATGDYSVADAAKILTRDYDIATGQQRLFTALHRLGWIYRAGDGRWRVKQTAVETGRLSEMPSSHYHPRTGELVLDPPQVRVTVKGVHDLHRALGAKAVSA